MGAVKQALFESASEQPCKCKPGVSKLDDLCFACQAEHAEIANFEALEDAHFILLEARHERDIEESK